MPDFTKVSGASAVPLSTAKSAKTSRVNSASKAEQVKLTRLRSSRDKLVKGIGSLGIDEPAPYRQQKSSLAARADARTSKREQRRQSNLEQIYALALDYAPAQGSNDELDIDWLESFLQQAQDISTPSMQQLWARILAAEASRPGSFSLKTLRTLKQLTSREADIFRRAQMLTCRDVLHQSNKIITGYYRRPSLMTLLTLHTPVQLNLARSGLSYPDVLALMDLGLLYPTTIETGELELTAPLQLQLGGQTILLKPRVRGLVITYHKYTAQGDELLKLLPAKRQQKFLETLQEELSRDFTITTNDK